jgi:hypothetical protein
VTIIGTNLLKSSGTTKAASVGGDVRFTPYAATATHTGTPDTPRQLSVVVPSGADDGRIRVSTFNDVLDEGAVLGALFIVPPPDVTCVPIETSRSDVAADKVPGRSRDGQRRRRVHRLRRGRSRQDPAARRGRVEDPSDIQHQLHRFLQEAHTRRAR